MNGIDMTNGPIIRRLIKVAVPILITNLLNMVHNLVDMFWLGQVSQTALSAVGAMGLFMWFGMCLAALSKTGTEIMVSQSYGKKDYKKVNEYSTNGLLLAIIIATIYGVGIFLLKDVIIGVYNFEGEEIKMLSYDYLKYLPLTGAILMINHQFMSTYNGTGNTKVVFIFVSTGLLINMILDPILILVLDMAVEGAAIATLIAMISILCMFGFYSKFKSNNFENFRRNIDFSKVKSVLNLGVVPMFHQMIFNVIFIMMSIYIVKFGDENVAVSRIGGQVESLTWIVGGAATTALAVFTGQNYGVGNFKRISRGFSFMMLIMCSYSLVISAILIMYGEEIFLIFLPNESATAVLGAMYLLINAPSQIFMMIEGVATGFFNGQGKTKIPAFASIFGNVIRIPLMIWLSNIYGINGVWMTMAISSCLKGTMLLVMFFISVVRNDEYKFRYFSLKKEVSNA